jgi:hypothetical protein
MTGKARRTRTVWTTFVLLGLGLTVAACPGREARDGSSDQGNAASSSEADDPSAPSRDFRGSMGAPPVPPSSSPGED